MKILFLCTGNSCRSQMAEAWTEKLHPEFEVHSAGTAPGGIDPRAVQVMAEAGIDLSGKRSKHIDALAGIDLDVVITVCDRARETCPVLPAAARHLHRSFDDPPRLAGGAETEEDALACYRRVRDEIRVYIEGLPRQFAV